MNDEQIRTVLKLCFAANERCVQPMSLADEKPGKCRRSTMNCREWDYIDAYLDNELDIASTMHRE
jgi:hypothetical protein